MERLRRIAEALKPYSFELARDVAEVSLAIKAASAANTAKVNAKLRTKINRELIKAKLDGNGRFEKPTLALATASHILADNGIEFDEIVSSHLLVPDQGNVTVRLALTNNEDVYSPIPITNSVLSLSWYKHDQYKYEAVAYMS